jgi:hypothetical protein
MAESQNNLTLVLNQQDENGVDIVKRTIGAIAYAGGVGNFFKGTLVGTGAVAFTLPTTNVLQAYVKNTHDTALYTVTATPQGGSAEVQGVLGPGSVWTYWSAVSGSTVGFTAVSLTSNTATGSTYEAYLGG